MQAGLSREVLPGHTRASLSLPGFMSPLEKPKERLRKTGMTGESRGTGKLVHAINGFPVHDGPQEKPLRIQT